MNRITRLLILVFILVGVIIGMMQCAQKSMHKRKKPIDANPQGNSLLEMHPLQINA